MQSLPPKGKCTEKGLGKNAKENQPLRERKRTQGKIWQYVSRVQEETA